MVSSTMRSIGFDHVEEFGITMQDLVEQYGLSIPSQPIEVFSLDIAIPEKKIAIEVDGPTHFVTRIDGPLPQICQDTNELFARKDGSFDLIFDWNGDLQEVNGATMLKQRLLTDLGWKVAHIPFWEWAKCNSEEERRKVCLQAVRDVGVNTDDLYVC
jgi:RAP domain